MGCRLWLMVCLTSWLSAATAIEIEVAKARLQDRVEQKFPLYRSKGPFWVKLEHPLVLLDGKHNQLGLSAAMQFQLLRGVRQGTLELQGTPVYDATEGQLVLEQLKVSHFHVQEAREDELYLLKQLLNKAIDKKLKRIPLYSLSQDRPRDQLLKLFLKSVRVGRNAMILVLGGDESAPVNPEAHQGNPAGHRSNRHVGQ